MFELGRCFKSTSNTPLQECWMRTSETNNFIMDSMDFLIRLIYRELINSSEPGSQLNEMNESNSPTLKANAALQLPSLIIYFGTFFVFSI